MKNFLFEKLKNRRILHRIFHERLAEPLHLNLLSPLVWLFGSYRQRIGWDPVVRQFYAYPLLQAADHAKAQGVDRISVVEFGVAAGAGLLNICEITRNITAETGIAFDIVGFDTGEGMPPPRDYRDHPEYYGEGDYPMVDRSGLEAALPDNATIHYGDVTETVPQFLDNLDSPIAFVSVDVDYYWSSVEALRIFEGSVEKYLPTVMVYLDDIQYLEHNPYCGEYLAVEEFNKDHDTRKVCRANFLREKRLFQRAVWINQIFICHVLDHPSRRGQVRPPAILSNPYLGIDERDKLRA